MPYTFFAHQAPVLPLKIWRPRWFDGTALCIGSMAPDLAYPLGDWLSYQSHKAVGVVVWALPTTLMICWAIRTWVASTAFAHVPDFGWFRAHSYRVLSCRRPPRWQTVTGALIGATTHVVIDAFAHPGRWGADWAGFSYDTAKGLQDVGHVFGSLIAFVLLAYIGRRRLFERWYGTETVARVRAFDLRPRQRVVFWTIVALGLPIGLTWSSMTTGVKAFRVIDSTAVTTAIACALPVTRPVASSRAQLQER